MTSSQPNTTACLIRITALLMIAGIPLITAGLASAAPNTHHGRFYVGLDLGAAVPHELESRRTNTGIPTNWDQWLSGATLPDGTVLPLPLGHGDCQPSALPKSPLRFNPEAGARIAVREYRQADGHGEKDSG